MLGRSLTGQSHHGPCSRKRQGLASWGCLCEAVVTVAEHRTQLSGFTDPSGRALHSLMAQSLSPPHAILEPLSLPCCRMKNPHLRAKLAEVLEAVMPHLDQAQSPLVSSVFHRKRVFCSYRHAAHLAEALIKVFVDIEFTGELGGGLWDLTQGDPFVLGEQRHPSDAFVSPTAGCAWRCWCGKGNLQSGAMGSPCLFPLETLVFSLTPRRPPPV